MTINDVILDSREPQWVKALTFDDAPVTVQVLPVGDAWIATNDANIVVERKELSDLLGSIADGRLFDQCARMVDVSPWCYIIVVGFPVIRSGCLFVNGRMTKWRWGSVQGALLTCQELGVGVVWCEDDAHYQATLEQLASRSRDGVQIRQKREAVMQAPGEIVLCALPGVSEVRARALLDFCGSAADALYYLTSDDERQVPGVGASTREAARVALGLHDGYQMVVVRKEEAA